MASIIGAVLLALAAGGTVAAILPAASSIVQNIVKYLRGIYGTRSTSTSSDTLERK